MVLAPLFPELRGKEGCCDILTALMRGRDCQAKTPLCWATWSHHKHKYELPWHGSSHPRSCDFSLWSSSCVNIDFLKNLKWYHHPYHSSTKLLSLLLPAQQKAKHIYVTLKMPPNGCLGIPKREFCTKKNLPKCKLKRNGFLSLEDYSDSRKWEVPLSFWSPLWHTFQFYAVLLITVNHTEMSLRLTIRVYTGRCRLSDQPQSYLNAVSLRFLGSLSIFMWAHPLRQSKHTETTELLVLIVLYPEDRQTPSHISSAHTNQKSRSCLVSLSHSSCSLANREHSILSGRKALPHQVYLRYFQTRVEPLLTDTVR